MSWKYYYIRSEICHEFGVCFWPSVHLASVYKRVLKANLLFLSRPGNFWKYFLTYNRGIALKLSLNIIFLLFHTADWPHKDCILMITTNNNHMNSHLEMKKTTIPKLSAVHQIPPLVQSLRHLLCGPGNVLFQLTRHFLSPENDVRNNPTLKSEFISFFQKDVDPSILHGLCKSASWFMNTNRH